MVAKTKAISSFPGSKIQESDIYLVDKSFETELKVAVSQCQVNVHKKTSWLKKNRTIGFLNFKSDHTSLKQIKTNFPTT